MNNDSGFLCRSGGYGHNIGCALRKHQAPGTEARLSKLDRAMQTNTEKVARFDDRDEGAVLATGARQSIVHEEGSASKSFILRLFHSCSRSHFGFFLWHRVSSQGITHNSTNRIERRTFDLVASLLASQLANHIRPPIVPIQFNRTPNHSLSASFMCVSNLDLISPNIVINKIDNGGCYTCLHTYLHLSIILSFFCLSLVLFRSLANTIECIYNPPFYSCFFIFIFRLQSDVMHA